MRYRRRVAVIIKRGLEWKAVEYFHHLSPPIGAFRWVEMIKWDRCDKKSPLHSGLPGVSIIWPGYALYRVMQWAAGALQTRLETTKPKMIPQKAAKAAFVAGISRSGGLSATCHWEVNIMRHWPKMFAQITHSLSVSHEYFGKRQSNFAAVPCHLGKLRGKYLKINRSKIDQGGRSFALMWAYDLFFIVFCTRCHFQMYGNGWRRVRDGLIVSWKMVSNQFTGKLSYQYPVNVSYTLWEWIEGPSCHH